MVHNDCESFGKHLLGEREMRVIDLLREAHPYV
jgi:hypothetical protein